MAGECTIPCSAGRLGLSLQARLFGDLVYDRLLVVGLASLLVLASPVVLLVAPAITAIVLAGWGAAAVAIVVGQAWLGAATPAREAMPSELRRLVEANVSRMHPSRIEAMQARAASLDLTHPAFDAETTRLLLDLREATGEAWKCPCPKRRLPIPLPF
jgi:hypothetical protein